MNTSIDSINQLVNCSASDSRCFSWKLVGADGGVEHAGRKYFTEAWTMPLNKYLYRTEWGIWKLLSIGVLLLSCAPCTERKEDGGLSIQQHPSLNFHDRLVPIGRSQ